MRHVSESRSDCVNMFVVPVFANELIFETSRECMSESTRGKLEDEYGAISGYKGGTESAPIWVAKLDSQ